MLTKKEQNQLTKHFSKTFITKGDVKSDINKLRKEMHKTFATKDALEDLRNDMANGFLEAKEDRDEIRNELRDFKEKTLAAFDEVMHELRAIREEVTIGAHHRSNNFNTLTNYEERICQLEKTQGLALA